MSTFKKNINMWGISILGLLVSATFAVKTPANLDYYLAAVVEYSPLAGKDTLIKNAEEHATIIKQAAPKADIIVFPEFVIFCNDDNHTFIEVPYGNNTVPPADDENAHPVLKTISKAARDQAIYVVINVREAYNDSQKEYHYNTNVVFDRDGKIIARYRKFNLFGGEELDKPSELEVVTFKTDFGVTFGLFTCFDILFEKPTLSLIRDLQISDIVFTTLWYSELPFLTAVQMQASWAYANDVNLLASCGNRIHRSSTGSGVFAGKKGPVVYLQSQRDETTILFSKVTKKGKSEVSTGEISNPIHSPSLKGLTIRTDPVITKMNSLLINIDTANLKKVLLSDNPNDYVIQATETRETKVCHGDKFCCNFKLNVTVSFKADGATKSENPYRYRLAAFDGITTYEITNAYVQFCSLISCLNDTLESCGKPLDDNVVMLKVHSDTYGDLYLYSTVFHDVYIKSENFDEKVFLFPSILEISNDPNVYGSLMNVSMFTFNSQKSKGDLMLSSKNLITGGIYGRVFEKDNLLSATFLKPTSFIILALSVLFCVLYKLY